MSANNSIQKITQAMADILKEFETNLAYHFSEVCGQPFARPSWIYISLTHECTYNCKMCGVVKILKGYSLAQEAVKQVLNEIRGERRALLCLPAASRFCGAIFLKLSITPRKTT
ncbi:MAG: hypothetical protein KKF93_05035 [Candidatus Omnitrophica bacterium]|nr:hypothetical protein [Candidatus Omnitrophota bacterium]